jgi:thiamine-monophosphate kinase
MQMDGISVIGHMTGPGEGAYLVTLDDTQVEIRAQGWDGLRK